MKASLSHFGKGRLALAAFAVLAAAAPAVHAAEPRLTTDYVVRAFDTIALRNEYRKIDNPRIIKWTEPLRIFVRDEVQTEPVVLKYMTDHLAKLKKLTGLDMQRVKTRDEANFVIIFTRWSRYAGLAVEHAGQMDGSEKADVAERVTHTNCLGLYDTRVQTGEIVRGVVIIPVDRARERGLLGRCIVEETTQLLGLPNDSADVNPSIFNDSSRLNEPSELDELLLKLLYSERMVAGLPREDALKVAREVLPTLKR